jgi:hypothetical protein
VHLNLLQGNHGAEPGSANRQWPGACTAGIQVLKQRKEFEKLQSGTTGRVVCEDHYEPVIVGDSNAKVRAKVEQAKHMPEEGIYHEPKETAYINDSTVKKNLSYLEVTA